MELKLIEAVRGRQVLYDTSHLDYMKSKYKSKIWDEIAREIEMESGSEAKIVWEKLRHSLRDALRRQAKYVRMGVPTSKPWKFQAAMRFLQPYTANSIRDSNIYDEIKEEPFGSKDAQESDSFVEPGSEEREDDGGIGYSSGNAKGKTLRKLKRESPSDLSGSSRGNSPTPQKRVKKKHHHTTVQKSVEIQEKKAAARAAQRVAERAALLDRSQSGADPLYHFFMSMYETTKNMPLTSQHVVKNQVYSAVTDMEASLLNIPQTYCIPQTSQFHLQNVQNQQDYKLSPESDSS